MINLSLGQLLLDLVESFVSDRVLAPVFVIKMPPFRFIHREPLRFHRIAQQLAVPPLERGSAGIIRICAVGRFVVRSDHLDRLPCLDVVKCQIDSGAAVVARTLGRVGHEDLFVLRGRVPKHLCHVPGAVGIVNEKTVTLFLQLPMCPQGRLGRRTLREGSSLRIKNTAKKIVGRRVPNIQLYRRIEPGQLDEVGSPKRA